MPNDEPVVRYTIKNEFLNNKEGKEPPLAEYEDFSDVLDYDEVDGELTPLTNGVEEGILVARKGPNRKIVPSGFFPQWPTFYSDVNLKDENVPNLNLYQQKKSMAQGMLDLALLSANANQLRYILDSNERNHYFYVSLSLISMSLLRKIKMEGESSNLPETIAKNSQQEDSGRKKSGNINLEPLLSESSEANPAVIDVSGDSEVVKNEAGKKSSEFSSKNAPDINMYQNKKTIGTGMMDFALLVTNVNQLKHIISMISSGSPSFYVTLTMVIISILLQLVLGIMLALNSRYDIMDGDDVRKADKINDRITVLTFIITAVNVAIPGFGLPN
ncbi:CLUMA_CG000968, isoform A [Clunio marinus]|uniref:CLUMA_CG000968, isoform A n=1 Tax=Clunio marinus TaxID=568069 RepID=A0A1J1HGM5_9DIPT|nr:CLUMA_CG000968, isoform A [Clunio marinus]